MILVTEEQIHEYTATDWWDKFLMRSWIFMYPKAKNLAPIPLPNYLTVDDLKKA